MQSLSISWCCFVVIYEIIIFCIGNHMVKITKVYTRTGDTGTTSLASQMRVAKNSPRITVLGELDELNAWLGLTAAQLYAAALSATEVTINLPKRLQEIQQQLFDLGAEIAVLPEDQRDNTPRILPHYTERLENEMDLMNQSLPPLTSFVLPGGGEAACRLHVARTVCRRAERTLVALLAIEPNAAGINVLPYLNRLSDWLFVAARWTCYQFNEEEYLWQVK
jgi:cob(I)alamin adenosyltransferase